MDDLTIAVQSLDEVIELIISIGRCLLSSTNNCRISGM